MIKGIVIMMVVAMAGKPVDVEKLWTDAKIAFEQYRFDEAVELMDEYVVNAKHNKANDGECAGLRNRAERAGEMLKATEDITILDSVKTLKSRMIEGFGIPREVGMLRQMVGGGIMFTTGRGDRNIVAEKEGGNFDLFLTYADGERQKLPEIINGGENENYPFEMTDGATLYFASEGHGSIGGYDLFMTRYNNETQGYPEPLQIGMPFNSIYNDYMMVIDELSGVGWFATDRYQNGDTVVIYKFRVTESKQFLSQELEESTKIKTAQMRRYKVGYDEKKKSVIAGRNRTNNEGFRFVVNDTLIYTDESQFRDSLSLSKYREMKELESIAKERREAMEGKKSKYQTMTDINMKGALRREILEDEEYLQETTGRIGMLTKEIRRQENQIINNHDE